MGIVWLASDEFLHRDVAIKEIQPRGREIRDTDPEVRRALREARAAAKLSEHPGIVTVHDVVTDDRGLPWIVMALLNGRSLHAVLHDDGRMSVDQAAKIGIQVLRALDYAHKAGVLHRDVKPGNVMLVEDKVVLTDFGIAVMDGASVLTATGQLPGAPEYVAPERILGEESLPAADLWSVGIMLYTMVVGRTPFHRKDVQATLGAALTRAPDPDPVVGRLAPVIDGLLRKKPGERMTAGQAIDKLTEIAAVPGDVPAGVRVRLEYPTMQDNPAGAVTVVDETVPNTRLDPPAFTPPRPQQQVPLVTYDSPTLDPAPPHWPSQPVKPPPNRRPLILVGIFLLVAAVVAAVIIAIRAGGDDNSGSPSTTQPTTTTSISQAPLTPHPEPLGFEIAVPADWQRTSSTEGALSSVSWQGKPVSPKVGALTVRVVRDTTAAGTPAGDYLTAEHQTQSANRDDYKKIALSGDGSAANLEYTFRDGQTHYRVQERALASGNVYTLTFTLFASDAKTLGDQWQDTRPLITEIRDSFRLTS
jgi:eukaryotic-like serine/threonine-protein kinase